MKHISGNSEISSVECLFQVESQQFAKLGLATVLMHFLPPCKSTLTGLVLAVHWDKGYPQISYFCWSSSKGSKDSFPSTGAWCRLKVYFVYFLLKGRRLNIQHPQLSAGNEHLATEEEGSCDLETDWSVGGMTLASLAGPDLHAKVPKAMKKPRKGNACGPSSVLFRPVKIFW